MAARQLVLAFGATLLWAMPAFSEYLQTAFLPFPMNGSYYEPGYGGAVAMDNGVIVVGTRFGDTSNLSWVYEPDSDGWGDPQRLIAVPGSSYRGFGKVVGISNTTILGTGTDASANPKSAYVFERGETGWQREQVLRPASLTGDKFGYAGDISGDRIIVTDIFDDTSAANGGAAYVFTRQAGVWVETDKLTASNASTSAFFGEEVALDGNQAIISNRLTSGTGASLSSVYFFEDLGAGFEQVARFRPGTLSDYSSFGASLDISGNLAIVGAPGTNYGNFGQVGSAFLYERIGSDWTQLAELRPGDLDSGMQFGSSVAVDGDYILVGATGARVNGSSSGAAYLFNRTDTGWSQIAKLVPSNPTSVADDFGSSVALEGKLAVVGAQGWRTNGAPLEGAVFVFAVPEASSSGVTLATFGSFMILVGWRRRTETTAGNRSSL